MSALTDEARDRSRRTFQQGLVAVVIIAVLSALAEWLQAGEFSWRTLGVSASTAVVMAVLAYLQKAYVDPYRDISKGE